MMEFTHNPEADSMEFYGADKAILIDIANGYAPFGFSLVECGSKTLGQKKATESLETNAVQGEQQVQPEQSENGEPWTLSFIKLQRVKNEPKALPKRKKTSSNRPRNKK